MDQNAAASYGLKHLFLEEFTEVTADMNFVTW